MTDLKAYQAQEGKEYYIDTGGWFGGRVPAIFVCFDKGEAVFKIYENGFAVECVIDANASIQAEDSEVRP